MPFLTHLRSHLCRLAQYFFPRAGCLAPCCHSFCHPLFSCWLYKAQKFSSSSPLGVFVSSSGPTPTPLHPSCAEGPRSGHSAQMGPHKCRVQRDHPLPCPAATLLLMQPRVPLAFQAFIHRNPQVLHRAAPYKFFSQSVHIWDCPDPTATPCAWPR